jgi:guanylate kinase
MIRNVLAITGISTSGKTYIARALPQLQFFELVSYTTRPIRAGELPGCDYHYVDDLFFDERGDDFVDVDSLSGYQYGLLRSDLETALSSGLVPCHVCTPAGVEALQRLQDELNFNLITLWVDVPEHIALYRMCKRWSADPKHDLPYLASRIANLFSAERGWSGCYHYAASDSNEFIASADALVSMLVRGDQPVAETRVNPGQYIDHSLAVTAILDRLRSVSAPKNHQEILALSELIAEDVDLKTKQRGIPAALL